MYNALKILIMLHFDFLMRKYNLFESHYLQNELKTLVRRGIPDQLRSRVWSALYRIKIRDLKEAKGTKYFENLCTKAAEADVSINIFP